MANDSNLHPVKTVEEAREKGRKGGIASVKARRQKKRGRELLLALLDMKETDPRIIEELERLGIPAKNITNEIAMHLRQIEKAKRKADTNAYKAVAQLAGYMEPDTAPAAINITISPAAAQAGDKWSAK